MMKKIVKKLTSAVKKKPIRKKVAPIKKAVKVQVISKKRGRPKSSTLSKFEKNPIILPNPQNSWEAWQTFNPGVVSLSDKIHFLYRAIGEDGVSRFGYAASSNGFKIDERLSQPSYEHKIQSRFFTIFSYFSGGSWGGAEDPRLVRIANEDNIYMTYTACNGDLRVALTSIKIDDFLNKRWKWKMPHLISAPGEAHKNWVLFPEKIGDKYAILHSLSPKVDIAYRDSLDFVEGEFIKSYYDGNLRRKDCWDKWVRGVGAPPIKTRMGWLLFYHAMDESDPGKYKVGVMILDFNDPTKILCRSEEPVLEPEEHYEFNGFKGGVVYVSGAVVKDGKLLVYYGASDSYVGVAHANLEEFLVALQKGDKPRLQLTILNN